jgi:hypothetical protein
MEYGSGAEPRQVVALPQAREAVVSRTGYETDEQSYRLIAPVGLVRLLP